jgi:predicted HTH domain antitoxin
MSAVSHRGKLGAGGTIPRENMPVTISDEVLSAAHISEPELRQELALTLFQRERLTLAQASRVAEMTQLAFQALLAERRIAIHYGVEEFHEDLRTLRQTERL